MSQKHGIYFTGNFQETTFTDTIKDIVAGLTRYVFAGEGTRLHLSGVPSSKILPRP